MMLRIRLFPKGKKHDPHYRVVVAEHSKPIQGKYLVDLGWYDPKTKKWLIKKELVQEWLGKGAKPSNRVAKVLKAQGMKHPSIVIKMHRPISKETLVAQKAREEAERVKHEAEIQAAKEAWEKESEEKVKVVAEEKEAPAEQETQEKTEQKQQDQPKEV